MYAIDISCSNGHVFESWFQSRASFEEQREAALISCPHCGDTNIEQKIAPVRIGKHGNPGKQPEAPKKPSPAGLAQIMAQIEKNFEDVGARFSEEAIKIHLGESEKRNIRGTATPEEAAELESEGIDIFKIPELQ